MFIRVNALKVKVNMDEKLSYVCEIWVYLLQNIMGKNAANCF